jgi:hypothetical protein
MDNRILKLKIWGNRMRHVQHTIRHAQHTITHVKIQSASANLNTQNSFLFPSHAMFRHNCPLALETRSMWQNQVHTNTCTDSLTFCCFSLGSSAGESGNSGESCELPCISHCEIPCISHCELPCISRVTSHFVAPTLYRLYFRVKCYVWGIRVSNSDRC